MGTSMVGTLTTIPSFSGAHNNAKYFIRVLVSHVACLQYTKEEQIPLFCFIYRSYHKPKAIGRRYTSQQHPSTLFHGIVVSTIATMCLSTDSSKQEQQQDDVNHRHKQESMFSSSVSSTSSSFSSSSSSSSSSDDVASATTSATASNDKSTEEAQDKMTSSSSSWQPIPSLEDKENETLWQQVYLTVVIMLNTVFYLAPLCMVALACAFYYGGTIVRGLLLVYMAFILLDPTPSQGGSNYRWLSYETIEWVRSWPTFWSSTAYFPAILHKTQDLEPTLSNTTTTTTQRQSQPYLFAYHPHGVIGMGVNCTLNTNCAGFRELFPGIRRWGVTLREAFFLPIIREYILAAGFISADKTALRTKLAQGDSVVLLVGGAAEALYAQPGRFTLYLQKRKGFIKLALETGAAIVPCLGFGENDAFDTYVPDAGQDKRLMQMLLSICKWLRFSTPLLKSPLPRRKPIHVVVGAPVKFDRDSSVEDCHAQYVAALTKLYNEHKAKYGHEHIPLEIL